MTQYYISAERELKILEKVTYYSSQRLQINYDLLYSYLLERVDRPRINFDPSLGKDYAKYFEISLRLMAMNYIRDKAWSSKINSTNLRLLTKVKKWGVAAAARRLPYTAEYLSDLLEHYRLAQSNTCMALDSYSINLAPSDSTVLGNPYVEFFNLMGGEEAIKKIDKKMLRQTWLSFLAS